MLKMLTYNDSSWEAPHLHKSEKLSLEQTCFGAWKANPSSWRSRWSMNITDQGLSKLQSEFKTNIGNVDCVSRLKSKKWSGNVEIFV